MDFVRKTFALGKERRKLRGIVYAELRKERAASRFDGLFGKTQNSSDLTIGKPLRDEQRRFAFRR